jgi:alpha-glucosidase
MIYTLFSPDKRLKVKLALDNGSLYYSICKDGHEAVARSPLALVTSGIDFTCGLELQNEQRKQIDSTYTIPAFKKAECRDHANALALTLRKGGGILIAEARAYNDGGAVRLTLKSTGDVKDNTAIEVTDEATCFALPHSAIELYAQKYIFTYEDHYHPVPPAELWQNRWAFPALARLDGGYWALYTEAPVYGQNAKGLPW